LDKGGKAIFFSHGGKTKQVTEELGCELVKLGKLPWSKVNEDLKNKGKFDKTPYEELLFAVYKKDLIKPFVEEEIEAFKNAGVDLIISSFNPTASISARALNIPLIVINSGTAIPPYYRQGPVTFPENYENVFTRILPKFIKNLITRWMLLNYKLMVKDFNKVAEKYGVKPFKNINDILNGDYTFVCDDINFLGIKPTKEFPMENFVGPISGGLLEKQKDTIDEDIKRHLNRPGKSILLMMGSNRNKKLYLNILEALNQTNYNVIAVYTTIKEDELPETKDNILLKKFIKSPKLVNKMVDLAIIHGGRGTVYTAAYSGKPIIGLPMYCEHQYNIDNMVNKGAGLRISKRFFKQEDLLKAIDTIFSNYETYLKNAQNLSKKLTTVPGEEKAAQRLFEIIEEKIAK